MPPSFTLTICLDSPANAPQPEAQQCQWSGGLQKDWAAVVSFPLPTSKPTLPAKQPCHQAGVDTRAGSTRSDHSFQLLQN